MNPDELKKRCLQFLILQKKRGKKEKSKAEENSKESAKMLDQAGVLEHKRVIKFTYSYFQHQENQ